MASVVAGGLFNAVAFPGAGFLFSKLNHTGCEDISNSLTIHETINQSQPLILS